MTTCFVTASLALVVAASASADPIPPTSESAEDGDLDLIPDEIREAPPPANQPAPQPAAPVRLHTKWFVEDVGMVASPARTVPVAYPLPITRWQNRTSIDLFLQWVPGRLFSVTLSDRLSVIEQDDVAFWSRQTVRADVREAYATVEFLAHTYLEAGRINVRNGAALGWNPTDFFKTRSSVGLASLDPSAARQNRLGTWMARLQRIWDGGSASVAYSPKLRAPSAIVDDTRNGLDPRFDATNAAHRLQASASIEFGGTSAQLLGYYELHRAKLGASLARNFGDAVVGYVEWAGGPEANLITRAFDNGLATGTLPPQAALLLPTNATTSFRNDVAAGAAWTIASRITLNGEYHFHQAGFDREDWRNWFDMGGAPQGVPGVAGVLWYVRGYANDQQEPTSRHQLFVRAAWPRAFTSQLELSGFAVMDVYKGSTLAQLNASYYVSGSWTLALYGAMNVGPGRSERGSLPQFGSLILQIVRYL